MNLLKLSNRWINTDLIVSCEKDPLGWWKITFVNGQATTLVIDRDQKAFDDWLLKNVPKPDFIKVPSGVQVILTNKSSPVAPHKTAAPTSVTKTKEHYKKGR